MYHFNLPDLRYEPKMAEKYEKFNGRLMVLPAVQSRKVENIKVAPPLKSEIKVQSCRLFLVLWWRFWSSVSLVGGIKLTF